MFGLKDASESVLMVNISLLIMLAIVFTDAVLDSYGRKQKIFRYYIGGLLFSFLYILFNTFLLVSEIEDAAVTHQNIFSPITVFLRTVISYPAIRMVLSAAEERTTVMTWEKNLIRAVCYSLSVMLFIGRLFFNKPVVSVPFLQEEVSVYRICYYVAVLFVDLLILYVAIKYFRFFTIPEKLTIFFAGIFASLFLYTLRYTVLFFNISIATFALSAYLVLWKRRKEAEINRIAELAEEKRKNEEQKNALENSRVSITLSQIQPHFMFNCLSSIQVLCEISPSKAVTALRDFARFMRSNMDAMSSDSCIPFEEVLDKLDCYVRLEQIRFGSKLAVEYEITETDFSMPCMVLQPIVENAIRHGVGEKHGGGTVWISSWKDNGEAVITVRDDGIGIEATSIDDIPKKDDGRSHVGISNVRDRLRVLCGGEMEFQSSPDKGTTVTIRIPLQEGKQ